ncbi:MAG: hypothetical protein VKJ24_13805, partial [Synechococcales bacterium]|nr:hypothetical protein [Synechococcales bacterium]
GDAVQRKRFLKGLWVYLPCKPLLRFILFYFIRLGFLDGKAGFTYACLLSQYEYQIGVKLYELEKFGGVLNQTSILTDRMELSSMEVPHRGLPNLERPSIAPVQAEV